jgi:protein-S-isoprenylcysteine O-methyltransferase Ste14
VLVFTFKMRAEERLMTEAFPDQYPEYRERVKAIIPFVA